MEPPDFCAHLAQYEGGPCSTAKKRCDTNAVSLHTANHAGKWQVASDMGMGGAHAALTCGRPWLGLGGSTMRRGTSLWSPWGRPVRSYCAKCAQKTEGFGEDSYREAM